MADVTIIDMNERWTDCWNCGAPTLSRWGLPIYNGDLVSNAWKGDWGGVPACEKCYLAHQRGELPTFDHCYPVEEISP